MAEPDDIVDQPERIKSETITEPDTIKKIVADDTPYTSAPELLQGIYSEFEKSRRTQAATIVSPPYQNLIAQAHNSSGKATCFVLGMLIRVDPKVKAPQALCVCPTRELVIQNEEVVTPMGKYTGITTGMQILLFSATFSDKVKSFAMKTIPKANYFFVEKEQLSLDVLRQYQIVCPDARSKINVLKDCIFPAAEKLGQFIIFVHTRGSASELHKRLEADGHKCTSIQGGLSHEERDRVNKEFRAGETTLIATVVLARGFHQAHLGHSGCQL